MDAVCSSGQVARSEYSADLLLLDVSRLLTTSLDRQLTPFGITFAQLRVLSIAAKYPVAGISQTVLAEALGLGKAAVGSVVDRLERDGYVSRRRCAQDRRVKFVSLTVRGEALLEGVPDVRGLINTAIMSGVRRAGHQQLLSMLSAIKRNLEHLEQVE
jgi:MarR family transcriptional regulator, transcriptional regulator for hemolysin